MKTCPNCKVDKPLDQYWKGQSSCIQCCKWKQKNRWNSRTPQKRLEQHLKYKYGVSPEDFLAAWSDQNGKCAICEDSLPDLTTYENRRRGYAIDHNHDTGEFRGILCTECNTLLGMAGDNPEILANAIRYLESRGAYLKKELVDNAAVRRKSK
jgi:hypothetical protein